MSLMLLPSGQDLEKQRGGKEVQHREHASIRRQLEDTAGYLRSVQAQEALALQVDKLHEEAEQVKLSHDRQQPARGHGSRD